MGWWMLSKSKSSSWSGGVSGASRAISFSWRKATGSPFQTGPGGLLQLGAPTGNAVITTGAPGEIVMTRRFANGSVSLNTTTRAFTAP